VSCGRFYIFFSMAMWSLCWLISVFFHRAATGSAAASLIVLVLFFGFFGVRGSNTSAGAKTLSCLSAPIGFGMGVEALLTLESLGTGVTDSTANSAIGDNMSYNNVMGMLALDFWIYLALAWYCSQVLPTEYGTSRHPLFLFTSAYWKGASSASKQRPQTESLPISISSRKHVSHFEPVSAAHSQLGVRIAGLRKEFSVAGQPLQVAVNGLNLDLYEGQLNVLLGHNGAGSVEQAIRAQAAESVGTVGWVG
jgi:ATP-binding cassette subfamily A (ABC1) protein 3